MSVFTKAFPDGIDDNPALMSPFVELSLVIETGYDPDTQTDYNWSWGFTTLVTDGVVSKELTTVRYNCHFLKALYDHLKKVTRRAGADYMHLILDLDTYWQYTYQRVIAAVDYYCSDVYDINFDDHGMNDFVSNVIEVGDEEVEHLQDLAIKENVWNGQQEFPF